MHEFPIGSSNKVFYALTLRGTYYTSNSSLGNKILHICIYVCVARNVWYVLGLNCGGFGNVNFLKTHLTNICDN